MAGFRRSLAVHLRREFAYGGKPLIIQPEDIVQTGTWRTGDSGWKVSALLKLGRIKRRIMIYSNDALAACARGISIEWVTPEYVVIHAAAR